MAWSDAARRAALEVRRRNRRMVTLYHGTSAERAELIRKQGLLPMKDARINATSLYHGVRGNSVYATPSFKEARSYARTMAVHEARKANLPMRRVVGYLGGDKRYPMPGLVGSARAAVVKLRVPERLLRPDRNEIGWKKGGTGGSGVGGTFGAYRIPKGLPKRYVVGAKSFKVRYRSGL